MIDVSKVNERFHAHYYTHGDLKQWGNPPQYLSSWIRGRLYATKITPEELPPWFVPITYWNTRYVDTSRVTDILYRPVRLPHYNHLFKDDALYLSYDGNYLGLDDRGMPSNYAYEMLWGFDLLIGLFSVEEYSGINISKQLDEIRAKVLRYNNEYNEPYPDPGVPYDPDELFEKARKIVKERKEKYETLHQGAHRPRHPVCSP